MTTYKEVEDITDSDEIISARNIVNPLIGQLEENDTVFINAIYKLLKTSDCVRGN